MPLAQPILFDAEPDFQDGPDGLIIRTSQEIKQSFLDSTAAARNYGPAREGEFMHLCAIPTIFVERWLREGFDLNDKNITARDIVAKLKAEGLEHFLTTNKRV